MKICIFEPSSEESGSASTDVGGQRHQLGAVTEQHSFETKFIHKSTAKEEIDAAVADGFDFYFNLLSGTLDDPVAGVEASQYLESLNLPSCGIRSAVRSRSRYEFKGVLQCINKNVEESSFSQHMTCTVIQMGKGQLALTPLIKREAGTELMQKDKDPALFERIQKLAIEAFVASGSDQSNMGCSVNIRIRSDGTLYVSNINPQPLGFKLDAAQDMPIIHSLPGGYRAIIDIFIANHLIRSDQTIETNNRLADQYSGGASSYEATLDTSRVPTLMKQLADQFDFTGTVFDLACGTGIFGRVLREAQGERASPEKCRLLGFDIALGMLKLCGEFGVYESVHADSMEETLINYRQYADTVDHVVCFTAIQLLKPEVFTFFLVLAFALTNKSVTFTLNDVPDAYNDWLARTGYSHMHSTNHTKSLEAFGIPRGWTLKWKHREFAWTSPMTNDDIYSTVYRFERVYESGRDTLFSKE